MTNQECNRLAHVLRALKPAKPNTKVYRTDYGIGIDDGMRTEWARFIRSLVEYCQANSQEFDKKSWLNIVRSKRLA